MTATRREFSAGGVIYKPGKQAVKVALIAKKGRAVWCLPKGKIEEKETAEEAALREVFEETGLKGRAIKKLGDITYWFISPADKARVFKKVRFFLFELTGSSLLCHEDDPDMEAEGTGWFTMQEALKIMTYPSERRIMRAAKTALAA